MLGRVVDHVAPLTECCEVAPAWSAEGRIVETLAGEVAKKAIKGEDIGRDDRDVIEMRGRQIDRLARHADRFEQRDVGCGPEPTSTTVAPSIDLDVPPDAIPSASPRFS